MDRRVRCRSQNTFVVNGVEFFWEVSRTEHDDGAITGSVYKTVRKPTTEDLANDPYCAGWLVKAGSFRINPDGSIARVPKFLKDAAKTFAGAGLRAPVGAGIGSGGPA